MPQQGEHKPVYENIPLDKIVNLTFAGGGVKGIAYIGVLKELKNRGMLQDIKRVGGTSAGAITALLVGLGYDPDAIEDIMRTINLLDFEDLGTAVWERAVKKLNLTKRIANMDIVDILKVVMKKKHGVSQGEVFLNWARKIIAEQLGNPDATFRDLKEAMRINPNLKEMMFVGADISGIGSALKYFSIKDTPDIRIADAVRISMSYPGAFEPYDLKIGDKIHTFMDGGLVNNDPREYYDHKEFLPEAALLADDGTNKSTLGLRVDAPDAVNRLKWNIPGEARDLSSFWDSLSAFFQTISEDAVKGRHKVHRKYGMVTIQIPNLGLKPLDLDISKEMKDRLIEEGRASTREYLDQYRSPGTLRDILVHDSLLELYRSKNDIQKEAAISRLRKQYHDLQQANKALQQDMQHKSAKYEKELLLLQQEKNQEALDKIFAELAVIEELSPRLFKTESPEEKLIKKTRRLLKLQAAIAEENREALHEILEVYNNTVEQYQEMYEEYSKGRSLLEGLAKNPKSKEIMDKLLGEIITFQAMRINYTNQMHHLKLCGEEADPALKKEYSEFLQNVPMKILAEAKALFNTESFNKRQGAKGSEFAYALILGELERVKKDPVKKDLDYLIDEARRNNDEYHNNLLRLQEGKQKYEVEIEKLDKMQVELEEKKELVGKNFAKMVDLSSDFSRFIQRQENWKIYLYEGLAYGLDLLFTGLRGALILGTAGMWYGMEWGSEKVFKWFNNATGMAKKLERIGVTENFFVPNSVLYLREVQKIRKDLNQIIAKVGHEEPRKAFEAYNEFLQKEKLYLERREGWFGFGEDMQKEILQLIATSKANLNKILKERAIKPEEIKPKHKRHAVVLGGSPERRLGRFLKGMPSKTLDRATGEFLEKGLSIVSGETSQEGPKRKPKN